MSLLDRYHDALMQRGKLEWWTFEEALPLYNFAQTAREIIQREMWTPQQSERPFSNNHPDDDVCNWVNGAVEQLEKVEIIVKMRNPDLLTYVHDRYIHPADNCRFILRTFEKDAEFWCKHNRAADFLYGICCTWETRYTLKNDILTPQGHS